MYILWYKLLPTEINLKIQIQHANQANQANQDTAESRHVKAEAEQHRAKLQPQVSAVRFQSSVTNRVSMKLTAPHS